MKGQQEEQAGKFTSSVVGSVFLRRFEEPKCRKLCFTLLKIGGLLKWLNGFSSQTLKNTGCWERYPHLTVVDGWPATPKRLV